MLCAKNHKNLLIFDEIIAKTKRVTFFASQCIIDVHSMTFDENRTRMEAIFISLSSNCLIFILVFVVVD